jgi:hypothetical protein
MVKTRTATDLPDEHDGEGGSYTVDPKTGRRILVERTAPPGAAPPGLDPPPETEGPDL